MARYIGIDLGTSSTLVFIRGKGVVLEEPTVAAVRRSTGELIETGLEAEYMLGRTPPGIEVIRPMSEGVISKYDITLELLRQFLKTAMGKRQIFKPYGLPWQETQPNKSTFHTLPMHLPTMPIL